MKLIANTEITPAIRFAADKLDGFDVTVELTEDRSIADQGYERMAECNVTVIRASGESGFMYGLTDLADLVRKGEEITDASVTPFIKNRGIKFNIPLDARTPSYSDASDSASKNTLNMWDEDFWHVFLDRMAENKYNVLSLWTLSPFPSLVRIPEYPNACIDDVKISASRYNARLTGNLMYDESHRKNLVTVKKMTVDEKIAFWRSVMQYAKDRCIRVFIFTWNLFVYGTEDSGYGIDDDQNNPVSRDFVYCGTKALLETYPLLAGIGITAGENLSFFDPKSDKELPFEKTDIGFTSQTYGRAVADYLKEHPERDLTVIHRMQMAKYDQISSAFKDFPGKFEISFKYSQAHMYSDTKPKFICGFLEEKSPDEKIWLTVRNDDYYMYRWGDPDFARGYLENMPLSSLSGFYMGPDGFTWGRDYMTRDDTSHPLFFDKMWYMFGIWGELSYNMGLGDGYFKSGLKYRFGLDDDTAETLFNAWKHASAIIPEFNCMHWHDFDFQWYPEGCCMYLEELGKVAFANINEFVECPAIPHGDHASVMEYAESLVHGTHTDKITPQSVIDSITAHTRTATGLLASLENGSDDPEYRRTLYDIKAMCVLGEYYAIKEQAAIKLAVYRLGGDASCREEAIGLLKKAAPLWKRYSGLTTDAYIPQVLTRYCGKVDVRDFDELADLDVLLAAENR